MEKDNTQIYNNARTVVGVSEEILKCQENYTECQENYNVSSKALTEGLEAYGGISRLEDESDVFASKLRKSEENLKNDLGKKSFFKKKMDISKYWDAGELENFKNFENVVDTHYGRFIGDVYAKLNKKGDVLVSPKERFSIGGRILVPGVAGVTGAMCGGLFAGISEAFVKTALNMERTPIELGFDPICAGAIVGGVGAAAHSYDALRGGLFTSTNPLSEGANDLEKRVEFIKETLEDLK